MKTRLLITAAVVAAGIVVILMINYTGIDLGQKYQYKFWQDQLEFENNNQYYRVLFSYSSDYGATFSEPQDVSMTDQNAHEPKMIIMNGDVILVWRDEVSVGTPNLSFAKSTDFGQTFEKKKLFLGARPDIKYYENTLYLTFVGPDWQILYSKSTDGGKTFSEPRLIFEVDWELSPYEERPTPTLEVDADSVVITWRMQDKEDQDTVWKAVDYGKDDSFEVTSSVIVHLDNENES